MTLFSKPVPERPGHRKGSSVTEFGAGEGRYAKHFRENGINRVWEFNSEFENLNTDFKPSIDLRQFKLVTVRGIGMGNGDK